MRPSNFSRRLNCLTVLLVVLTCANLAWAASSAKLLYQFTYGPDGEQPEAPLVADSAGNLYGTTFGGGTYGRGIVFKLTPNGSNGWTGSVLYAFTGAQDGGNPQAGLILDTAGNLYGTTSCGGVPTTTVFCTNGNGVIFELTPQPGGSWVESVLYSFTGGNDGAYPLAGLVFDAAGNIYGTTEAGGTGPACLYVLGCGTVFELTHGSGVWTESVLHTFTASGDGALPNAGVIFDTVGNLYGTTLYGGSESAGVIFELTPGSGAWTESVLYNFSTSGGSQPRSGLIFDAVGNLYGTTQSGGSFSFGTVFELITSHGGGWVENTLYSFAGGRDGALPASTLVFDSMGNLYGTTAWGAGTGCSGVGCGTVFELSPNLSGGAWTETVLHRFSGNSDGGNPAAGLLRDANGNLYGTGSGGGAHQAGTVFKLAPGSGGTWTGSMLHTFSVGQNGGEPSANLLSDSSGNLFGTTALGGAYGYGTVFELDTTGKETVLYSFAGGKDGANPVAGLVLDGAGNLYGTTENGGGSPACVGGCGTVFELASSGGIWKEAIIHAFVASDGSTPLAGVIFDASGNLYGTTYSGGAGRIYPGGTVFELMPGLNGIWTESLLASFDAFSAGPAGPMGGVVLDKSGNLWGTTSSGCAVPGCGPGYGTVFELIPGSNGRWAETFPLTFAGTYGEIPRAGLVLDGAGNFYGTTTSGGSACCGLVFELSNSNGHWIETILYNFSGGSDGAYPAASVAFDPAGNLYGTTQSGGGEGQCSFGEDPFCGTVFELTPASGGIWNEKILHSFSGKDGAGPTAGVLLDPVGGHLYGTTSVGGGANFGVVFEFTR